MTALAIDASGCESWMAQESREVVTKSSIELKIEKAKREMGDKWVGHPNYKFNPRHSNNPEIYIPARAEYLRSIAEAARKDRERNPAHIRARAITSLMEVTP